MRYEMVQCDDCDEESCLLDEAGGWAETKTGDDLCPGCADARALDAEHDLNEVA